MNATNSEEIFEELISAYPEHLPVYLARLQALDSEKDRNLKAIVETADAALKNIDISELLEFYGMKSDTRKEAAKIKRYLYLRKTTNYLKFNLTYDFLLFLVAWKRTNLTSLKL